MFGVPYQPVLTDSVVPGSMQQQAGTSNPGCEFASRSHLEQASTDAPPQVMVFPEWLP